MNRNRTEYNNSNRKSNLTLEHIRTEYISDDKAAFNDIKAQKEIAEILFQEFPSTITHIEKDPYFKGPNSERKIQKIHVKFENNEKKNFYIKNSWEGKYLEGCGMALHNLFFKEKFNFLLSEKKNSGVVAIEEIRGFILADMKNIEINNEVIKNYGSALEFAAMIGLDDRQSRNFIMTPECQVLNIDFGQIFQKIYHGELMPCIHIPKEFKQQSKYGKIEGRKTLRAKLEDNKEHIEDIIQQTEEFRGFENTVYASRIKHKYIDNPYNAFIENLERMN